MIRIEYEKFLGGDTKNKRWEEVGCCKDEVLWQASDDKMRLEDAEKKRKYENFQMERWKGEKGKRDEMMERR